MRIIFSVFTEDYNTQVRKLCFSKLIETSMTIEQIDSYLQIYDLFHSELEVGVNLAFWDIYCFGNFEQEIIGKIKSIPLSKSEKEIKKEPRILKIEEFDPGNTDVPFYPDLSTCYFYRVSRYECGASSFDAMVAYIVENSILSNVVSSVIFRLLEKMFSSIIEMFKLDKKNKNRIRKRKKLYFSIKDFYKNFYQMTNIRKFDCQIVELNKKENKGYYIRVRTVKNECYEVEADYRGRIKSLCLVSRDDNKKM